MILTCPACATRFNAKDEAFLPAGRKVRCAKCGESWFQAPPEGAAPAAAPALSPAPQPAPPSPRPEPVPAAPLPEPEPEAFRAARAPAAEAAMAGAPVEAAAAESMPRDARTRWAVYAGWGLLLAAIALVTWGAVAYRQSVASAWPRSASVYAALGLPVAANGIAFTDVRYDRRSEHGRNVLAVTGTLVNVSARSLAVPPVRVVLSDADGRVLYHWEFRPGPDRLAPHQHAAFTTQLASPPDSARHLTLELAPPSGGGR